MIFLQYSFSRRIMGAKTGIRDGVSKSSTKRENTCKRSLPASYTTTEGTSPSWTVTTEGAFVINWVIMRLSSFTESERNGAWGEASVEDRKKPFSPLLRTLCKILCYYFLRQPQLVPDTLEWGIKVSIISLEQDNERTIYSTNFLSGGCYSWRPKIDHSLPFLHIPFTDFRWAKSPWEGGVFHSSC